MKYKLSDSITIDESAKEDIKKMMKWSENDFEKYTEVIEEIESLSDKNRFPNCINEDKEVYKEEDVKKYLQLYREKLRKNHLINTNGEFESEEPKIAKELFGERLI